MKNNKINDLKEIHGKNGGPYYYDEKKNCMSDALGNLVYFHETLDGVKEPNLALYLDDLFEDLYELRDRFDRNCKFDKVEDIIWS